MEPDHTEDQISKFVQLERARCPKSEWQQCEVWIEADWAMFQSSMPWYYARFHILERWSADAPKTHSEPKPD